MKKGIDHYKSVFKIIRNYLSLIQKIKSGSSKSKESPTLFCDISMERTSLEVYYFSLIYYFHTCGFRIEIKNDIRQIGRYQKMMTHLFGMENIRVSKEPSSMRNTFLLHTKENTAFCQMKFEKTFCIESDYFSFSNQTNSFHFPFMMHPDAYITGSYKTVREIAQNTEKKCRVLFAGNINKEAYSSPRINSNFSILNRHEIIAHISETMELYKDFDYIESLEKYLKSSYQNQLMFSTFDWSANGARKNMHRKTPFNQWFQLLATSDFWLSCPGVAMPHCHNIIEAMSVGVIPILEYEPLLFPKLEHAKNCVFFHGKADLIQKLKMVMTMDKSEIEVMKKNVLDYYEKHIDIHQVVKKLLTMNSNNVHLVLNCGFKSVEILEKKS